MMALIFSFLFGVSLLVNFILFKRCKELEVIIARHNKPDLTSLFVLGLAILSLYVSRKTQNIDS